MLANPASFLCIFSENPSRELWNYFAHYVEVLAGATLPEQTVAI